ncbi:MAG: SdpI family protein [Oscillospiraceae bacterium]|nr:SdpI family protein [Oscillospiraceae bacterium]MBQ9148525.1 SdpI family protein [Oscillospiraceae bacterium]
MTIDSLKALMDGFDPAALLPDLSTIVGKVELAMRIAVILGPVLLLVVGLLYFFAPPKEANYYFGYRCYFGMGSVNAWRFSQRLAGFVWGVLGLILSVVMLIVSSLFSGKEIMEIISSAVTCVIWEVVLVAISCLAINTLVALRYDRNGEERTPKQKQEKELAEETE